MTTGKTYFPIDAPRLEYQQDSQPLIDIGQLFRTLWARRLLIAGVTLAFVAFAALYLVVTPATYKAEATVLIDPRQQRSINADAVLSGIGPDSAAIASQSEIIRSRQILRAVFDTLGLAADPEFARAGLLARLSALVSGTGASPSEEAVFERFRKKLSVERQGLTYILEVAFTSRDPDKAAFVVNTILDRYLSSQIDEKSSANTGVTEYLEQRIERLQADVAAAEIDVENFKAQHRIVVLNGGGTLLQAQIDQLNQRISAAQEEARAAVARLARISALQGSVDTSMQMHDVVSSLAMDQLRAQYNLRVTELSSIQAKYGPRHPRFIDARKELDQVVAQIRGEAARIKDQLIVARDLANANVAAAQAELDTLRTQLDTTNAYDVELRNLDRRAEAARQVLENFLRRWRETDVMDGLQRSDARVISAAAAPVAAAWPKSNLLLALSGLLGIGVGVASALAMGAPARGTTLPAGGASPAGERPFREPRPVSPPVNPVDRSPLGTYPRRNERSSAHDRP